MTLRITLLAATATIIAMPALADTATGTGSLAAVKERIADRKEQLKEKIAVKKERADEDMKEERKK